MASVRQIESSDLVLSGEPLQRSRRREQVGAMSGPGVLAAMPAMAEIEMLEVSGDFEADGAAQARTGMLVAHFSLLSRAGP